LETGARHPAEAKGRGGVSAWIMCNVCVLCANELSSGMVTLRLPSPSPSQRPSWTKVRSQSQLCAGSRRHRCVAPRDSGDKGHKALCPLSDATDTSASHPATSVKPTVIAGQAQGPRLGAGGSCGDGSTQLCMVMMTCPPGTMSAVMNGCTSCVDPTTCLASNGH
jgi:hypothetical protein